MTTSRGVGRGRPPATEAGDRYARLTVLNYAGSDRGERWYSCVCACGRRVTVRGAALRAGHTKSCGCLKSETSAQQARKMGAQDTHGLSRHPGYTLWQGMHRRCEDPLNKSWRHYGARGITVCERWSGPDGFPAFLADMGPQPGPRWHLHRMDRDRGYEPGNCEWLSPAEHGALHAALRRG
jgi:hypothetical protein